MVGMTVDGVSTHHPNVGFRCVGAGWEPASTIVSIVLMCDDDAVWWHGMLCPYGVRGVFLFRCVIDATNVHRTITKL
jgi:hypothetical protein